MEWWLRFMPLQALADPTQRDHLPAPVAQRDRLRHRPGSSDRPTASCCCGRGARRIYFLRQFFDYPITLSPSTTLANLGLWRDDQDRRFATCGRLLFPIKPEKNLEDFFINRFGRELYRTFFKRLHREGLGRALRGDHRRVGRPADQGPLDREGDPRTSCASPRPPAARHRAEGHRDLAHRAVPLSQARARADVGRRWRAERARARRRDPPPSMEAVRLELADGRVTAVDGAPRPRPASGDDTPPTSSSPPCRSATWCAALDAAAAAPRSARSPRACVYRDFITVGLLLRG